MDGRVGFRRETGHRNQVSVHRFLKIAVKPLIRHLPAASLQLCVQHPVELRETLVEMALAVNHVGSSRIVNKKKEVTCGCTQSSCSGGTGPYRGVIDCEYSD